MSEYIYSVGAPSSCCEGVPKSVVSESAASRNSVVEMALSWVASTGTSTKDLRIVSKKGLLLDCEAVMVAGRCGAEGRCARVRGGSWSTRA